MSGDLHSFGVLNIHCQRNITFVDSLRLLW